MYTLITLFHTGSYSICEAFRRKGLNVIPQGGIRTEEKIKQIADAPDDAIVWAHWAWADQIPRWRITECDVITVLRDPIECAMSAYLRGLDHKCIRHAEQWLLLWHEMNNVDHWIDFKTMDLSRVGLTKMPHLNATNPADEIKNDYKFALTVTPYDGKRFKKVRFKIFRQWDCLMVVRREIRQIFRAAGMEHLIKRSPINFD